MPETGNGLRAHWPTRLHCSLVVSCLPALLAGPASMDWRVMLSSF